MIEKLLRFRIFRFFLESGSRAALVGKCLLLLLIPYAYLLLCGLVFDMLLKWYFMTTFIFVSLIVFYIAAILLAGLAVSSYVRKKH